MLFWVLIFQCVFLLSAVWFHKFYKCIIRPRDFLCRSTFLVKKLGFLLFLDIVYSFMSSMYIRKDIFPRISFFIISGIKIHSPFNINPSFNTKYSLYKYKCFSYLSRSRFDESHPFIMVSANFTVVGLLVVSCRILSSRSLFTFDVVMFLIS